MRRHGGVPIDIEAAGFRHFLGGDVLPPADRFTVDGRNPTYEEKFQAELQGLMGRLAHRMSVPYDDAEDNPRIPSGYTYLLQLVAHDLVQSSVAVSLVSNASEGVRNTRQGRLWLDTIYGAGPELQAFAYAMEERDDASRARLRLGRMAPDPVAGCPFRDIARVSPENVTGLALSGGRTDVLIADARNDDHAILSQLTALFHLLHNGIVAKLLPKPGDCDPGAKESALCKNFLCARAAVTLIYRNIIRRDLMRRVLHPDVYAAYANVVARAEVIDTPDARIPLEFSHAACRFGHAMVRNSYKINTLPGKQRIGSLLRATSLRGPLGMPLGREWIVAWSNFFEIDGSAPNLSQRIRPTYAPGLLDEEVFPQVGETRQPGLASRDLFSSAELGLWSVQRLLRKLLRVKGKPARALHRILKASPLLADKRYRRQRLTAWLSLNRELNTLRDADIALLAKEPPLLFFIQFEAWEEQGADGISIRGAHLGVLGSIIVADVIFGALTDRPRWEAASLGQGLKNLSHTFYGVETNVFASVPEIATMAELIGYLARLDDLQNALPAFL
jgi:hypothetical protein